MRYLFNLMKVSLWCILGVSSAFSIDSSKPTDWKEARILMQQQMLHSESWQGEWDTYIAGLKELGLKSGCLGKTDQIYISWVESQQEKWVSEFEETIEEDLKKLGIKVVGRDGALQAGHYIVDSFQNAIRPSKYAIILSTPARVNQPDDVIRNAERLVLERMYDERSKESKGFEEKCKVSDVGEVIRLSRERGSVNSYIFPCILSGSYNDVVDWKHLMQLTVSDSNYVDFFTEMVAFISGVEIQGPWGRQQSVFKESCRMWSSLQRAKEVEVWNHFAKRTPVSPSPETEKSISSALRAVLEKTNRKVYQK